jgi:TonB family protein
MYRFVTALVLAWLPVEPLLARETVRLKPTSSWYLDYAEDSCRLARKFGEGKQEVLLFLDQYAPGDGFHIILGGNILRPRTSAMFLNVSLRFGPDEQAFDTKATAGDLGDKRALIFSGERIAAASDAEKERMEASAKSGTPVDWPPIGAARESAVRWMEVKGALREDLVLEIGPMRKSLDALRDCSWDTVKSWGLDVEQQKTLSRSPIPLKGPEEWFFPKDYPGGLVRGGIQGNVNFRLIIDETGKIASCHIQTSTRPKEFDDLVCKLAMKRGRFQPALDAAGKPARSYWRQTVLFRLQ